MNKLEATAVAAYHRVTSMHDENPFELGRARIFKVSEEGKLTLLAIVPDVYIGLTMIVAGGELFGDAPILGLETCGWAAPISGMKDDDETMPSMHPKRRRVRLVSVVNRDLDTASALAFQDDEHSVISDDGSATGSLAEALRDAMQRLRAVTAS
jgi:hypothetical protein